MARTESVSSRCRRPPSGFALPELVVAALLLGIGVVGAASAIAGTAARGERAADRTERVLLARERLERIRAGVPLAPYDSTIRRGGRIYRVVLDTAALPSDLTRISVRVRGARGADLELTVRRRAR